MIETMYKEILDTINQIKDNGTKRIMNLALMRAREAAKKVTFSAIMWRGRGEEGEAEGAQLVHRLKDDGFKAALLGSSAGPDGGQWAVEVETSQAEVFKDRQRVQHQWENLKRVWAAWPASIIRWQNHQQSCPTCAAAARCGDSSPCKEGSQMRRDVTFLPPAHRDPNLKGAS